MLLLFSHFLLYSEVSLQVCGCGPSSHLACTRRAQPIPGRCFILALHELSMCVGVPWHPLLACQNPESWASAQSFWVSRFVMQPKNLHFQWVFRWSCCYQPRDLPPPHLQNLCFIRFWVIFFSYYALLSILLILLFWKQFCNGIVFCVSWIFLPCFPPFCPLTVGYRTPPFLQPPSQGPLLCLVFPPQSTGYLLT